MRWIIPISFFVLALDQFTKTFFSHRVIYVNDFFSLSYTENIGAAFGILKGFNLFFVLIGFFVLFMIFHFYKEIIKSPDYVRIGIGLMIGGILGNMIDRLFLGYVRDFIAFSFWPAFNFADASITLSVGLLSYYILTKK